MEKTDKDGKAEQELVVGLLNRDAASLERLMDLYGGSVHALASSVLGAVGSKEDREECVSDVFVAAWHKIADYDPAKGSLKTWLGILAKYKALDYRRKMNAKPLTVAWSDDAPGQADTERVVLIQEQRNELLRQLELLGEPDRSICYKRYFFYEPLEEIAASLGLTRKAVESRLGRIRKLLRLRLNGEGEKLS